MGSQIKLEKPGDEHTMKIAEVRMDDSGTWPSVMFFGENGDFIKMTGKTAEAKLQRLNWTIDDLDALAQREAVWLRFGRDENPNRGQAAYWSIELAQSRSAAPNTRTATRTPPATDRASQSPPAATTAKAEPAKVQVPLFEAYKVILQAVIDEVHPIIVGDDQAPMSEEGILACVATIFIQACKEPNRPVFAAKARSQARRNEPPPPTDADKPEDDHLRGGDDEYGF